MFSNCYTYLMKAFITDSRRLYQSYPRNRPPLNRTGPTHKTPTIPTIISFPVLLCFTSERTVPCERTLTALTNRGFIVRRPRRSYEIYISCQIVILIVITIIILTIVLISAVTITVSEVISIILILIIVFNIIFIRLKEVVSVVTFAFIFTRIMSFILILSSHIIGLIIGI